MGVLIWLIAGVLVAAGFRILGSATKRGPVDGVVALALLGAVLGGFAVDLAVRGDSVMDFRGPTALGASVGAVLLVGAGYATAWLRSPSSGGGS